MASLISSVYLLLLCVICIVLLPSNVEPTDERKLHIVYLGGLSSSIYSTQTLHLSLLDQVLEGCTSKESLVYSYTRSFAGFAAKLTTKEREKLAGMKGIISVFPNKVLQLRTTRSWDFLSFPQNVNRNPATESNVIIGMLDSGIWPESSSFSDKGLGPPPRKWKGSCVIFNCTNKIIGARYYNSMNDMEHIPSPRDYEGHGTHTSSTAAGRSAYGVSLYGLAGGTARGAVPSARLAVYKVCWTNGCADVDILAAFDDAIADGVDILSVSLGSTGASVYFEDSIAIGAFHAMRNGILTSASGGNSGPKRGTVSNVAPWMLVSAASSTDRHITTKLLTGDQSTITGASVNTFATDTKSSPFVYFGDSMDCSFLDASMVKGKVVLCGYINDGSGPLVAGAKGAVMVSSSRRDTSFSFPLPVVVVSKSMGNKLQQYIKNSRSAMVNIRKSEAVFDSSAPIVASFSSRGPNLITPNILKPDISAPGIDIIAAWSPKASMSGYWNDTRSVTYNIISGTSMACPHVSGAAAYVKSFHPDWSPAAIMSALMTTAKPMNPYFHQDVELAYGSGQVNPVQAVNPGLIYDATETDYVQMLCNQGYDRYQISLVTGHYTICPSTRGATSDLNYPSMAMYVDSYDRFAGQFPRTVTNVGAANSVYKVSVKASPLLTVTVKPSVLSFKKIREKQSFVVTVSGGPLTINSIASASITWSDGKHTVRSPIVIHTDYTN